MTAIHGDYIYGVSGVGNGGGPLPWCSLSLRDGSTHSRTTGASRIVTAGDAVYFVGAVNRRSTTAAHTSTR
jgi:hypothetical protein